MTIVRESYMQEYEIASWDAERVEFPFDFAASGAETIHCFDIDPSLSPNDDGYETEIPQSGFTVTAAAAGLLFGGKATLAEPVAVGHVLRIRRITPKTQERVFRNQRAIPPEQVEAGLDRLTLISQEEQGRGIEVVIADIDDLRIDVAALEAGKADGDDPRLSDAREPLPHAASHAEGGSDPVSPAAIGALGLEHIAPSVVPDPHPQYATIEYVDLTTGSAASEDYFSFGANSVKVKAEVDDGTENELFELIDDGILMKGTIE